MGEPLLGDELDIFKQLTGRDYQPTGVCIEEFWGVVGRRSGKTRAAAVLAVYFAILDYSDKLSIGERGVVAVLSASLAQAQRAFQYVSGVIAHVPAFKRMVETKTADTIKLTNGIDIECRPASFRTIRGLTAAAIICDEISYWRSDETSRNPDSEILAAARPALSTLGGPLICVSSPYAKRGEAWNAFKRDFGPEGDPKILVVNAASRVMNPTLSESIVSRAYERDPQNAAAEFGGEFRSDVSGFLGFNLVESAVDYGVAVRPPTPGVIYRAAADPSGGASDSFTLSVCHDEGETAVLDCLVEIKAPFNPTSAVEALAATLKEYRLSEVTGDRYAAGWVPDAFKKVGVRYVQSERDRSAAYLDALPLFTAGRVRLLDNPRLVSQFAALERRTSAAGKDRVDHGPGGRDDCCNSAALALSARTGFDSSYSWVSGPDDETETTEPPAGGRPLFEHPYFFLRG
jgi:Terminase large subunit, T4likevirus-type, N-terminal